MNDHMHLQLEVDRQLSAVLNTKFITYSLYSHRSLNLTKLVIVFWKTNVNKDSY